MVTRSDCIARRTPLDQDAVTATQSAPAAPPKVPATATAKKAAKPRRAVKK